MLLTSLLAKERLYLRTCIVRLSLHLLHLFSVSVLSCCFLLWREDAKPFLHQNGLLHTETCTWSCAGYAVSAPLLSWFPLVFREVNCTALLVFNEQYHIGGQSLNSWIAVSCYLVTVTRGCTLLFKCHPLVWLYWCAARREGELTLVSCSPAAAKGARHFIAERRTDCGKADLLGLWVGESPLLESLTESKDTLAEKC